MKWEDAVAKSPAKACYRILTDGRLSYVDANGVIQTQINLHDRSDFHNIGIQARNRRKDWKPMPVGFMTRFRKYGLNRQEIKPITIPAPAPVPKPDEEDPAIKSIKELFQKIGVDFQITITLVTKPTEAVITLADLASRWLNNSQ